MTDIWSTSTDCVRYPQDLDLYRRENPYCSLQAAQADLNPNEDRWDKLGFEAMKRTSV